MYTNKSRLRRAMRLAGLMLSTGLVAACGGNAPQPATAGSSGAADDAETAHQGGSCGGKKAGSCGGKKEGSCGGKEAGSCGGKSTAPARDAVATTESPIDEGSGALAAAPASAADHQQATQPVAAGTPAPSKAAPSKAPPRRARRHKAAKEGACGAGSCGSK